MVCFLGKLIIIEVAIVEFVIRIILTPQKTRSKILPLNVYAKLIANVIANSATAECRPIDLPREEDINTACRGSNLVVVL